MISILTATYNRADLLPRIFESLQKQINNDFEWVIVDDGSSDETEEVIKSFKPTNFLIHYYKKENGGKHTALNLGVKKCNGTHILMLDSDDYLTPNAVSFILEKINLIKEPNTIGIAGRRIYENGDITGSNNFSHHNTSPLAIKYKYHVTGDLVEVFSKYILEQYPFPIFQNEKFCPEDLVWNRIAQQYKLDYYNYGFYVTEYLPGGLTDRIIRIRMNSPKASMTHYSELASYNVPFKEKIKATINFWRFSFNDKDWSFKEKLNKVNKLYSLVCLPLGYFMYMNDKRKVAK